MSVPEVSRQVGACARKQLPTLVAKADKLPQQSAPKEPPVAKAQVGTAVAEQAASRD